MRKIAWTLGYCCDLGVLFFAAWVLYTTYDASVVETPSHIPPENIITTPPDVYLPEEGYDEPMGVFEEMQRQPQVVPLQGKWADCVRRLQRTLPTPDRRWDSLA